MNAPAELAKVIASQPDASLGYKDFSLGSFGFRRDEYFAHITWKTGVWAGLRSGLTACTTSKNDTSWCW